MNEKTKHTPGPWKAGLIKSPMGTYDWQVHGGNGHLVLQVSEGTVPDNHDKALLEAAPELLEALEGLVDDYRKLFAAYQEKTGEKAFGWGLLPAETADEALAKARGEKGGGL